jgi:transforming growth factor-beta-induced protein
MLTKKIALMSVAGALILAACATPPAVAPTTAPAPTEAPAPTAEPTAAPTEAPAMEEKDIVDTAIGAGSFNTLAAALTAAGLVETLKGEGPFTVFAPTDEAFAKIDPATLENLLKPENKDQLTAILTYHVVPGRVAAADVVNLTSATTVQGEDIAIKVDGGNVMINDATVVTPDVMASNGIIHVIDTVIMPPSMAAAPAPAPEALTTDIVDTAVAAGDFNTLAAALTAAGLVDTLKGEGPFTVFAPSDAAFAKLDPATLETLLKPENKDQLTAILTYHVVPGAVLAADAEKLTSATTVQGEDITIAKDGDALTINGATVITPNIVVSNGVIHVIDSVIMPPSMATTSTATTTAAAETDIVDTAIAAGNFTTLATALTAAGLVETLKGEGPFTVFAPSDEAFAKLDKATLENLLKPENKESLIKVLTYHVVPGRVTAADVAKLTSAKTVEGQDVTIKVDGGKVMINGATVTAADILTSNGVIHVIDTVILPPDMS